MVEIEAVMVGEVWAQLEAAVERAGANLGANHPAVEALRVLATVAADLEKGLADLATVNALQSAELATVRGWLGVDGEPEGGADDRANY